MTKNCFRILFKQKKRFGYNTENDNEIVGWIKLYKRFPIEDFLNGIQKLLGPKTFQEQMKIKAEPYRVNIAQVTRKVFESDKFRVTKITC